MRIALLLASVAISLLLAEGAATLAARGAYPYLNLFLADAELGVVLEANATARVKSRLGHITRIDTDTHGRRIHPTGSGPHRVLLLGDSQVFGYLVDAEDAVASQLGALTGAEVIDAAVPSYGPDEYAAVAARLIPELHPDTVVFVANVANDWWEATAKNTRRSTARDGWLVTALASQPAPVEFPGRRFLLGRSHLVLAIRRVAAHAGGTFDPAVPLRLMRDLAVISRPRGEHRSRITRSLLEVDRIARANGAVTIAVALPLDVMCSAEAWKKYGLPPQDLSPAFALLSDLTADAADAGIAAVDLRPILSGAPELFLEDDPHLSSVGHRAFARALAEKDLQ